MSTQPTETELNQALELIAALPAEGLARALESASERLLAFADNPPKPLTLSAHLRGLIDRYTFIEVIDRLSELTDEQGWLHEEGSTEASRWHQLASALDKVVDLASVTEEPGWK